MSFRSNRIVTTAKQNVKVSIYFFRKISRERERERRFFAKSRLVLGAMNFRFCFLDNHNLLMQNARGDFATELWKPGIFMQA
jgi:hypothetical protein